MELFAKQAAIGPLESVELVDAGDRVVVHARGAFETAVGDPVREAVMVITVRDGRIVHIDIFGAFHVGDTFYQLGGRSGVLPREAIVPAGTVVLEGVDLFGCEHGLIMRTGAGGVCVHGDRTDVKGEISMMGVEARSPRVTRPARRVAAGALRGRRSHREERERVGRSVWSSSSI